MLNDNDVELNRLLTPNDGSRHGNNRNQPARLASFEPDLLEECPSGQSTPKIAPPVSPEIKTVLIPRFPAVKPIVEAKVDDRNLHKTRELSLFSSLVGEPHERDRLNELAQNRKRFEVPLPVPKHHETFQDIIFKVANAPFIIDSFQDSVCCKYLPREDGDTVLEFCKVCGLSFKFHEDSALQSARNASDSGLESLTDSPDASKVRSFAAASKAVCAYVAVARNKALTFGSVRIPMRFVNHADQNVTKGLFMRNYVKFDAESALSRMDKLTELLQKWNISQPSFVMTVTGGDMSKTDKSIKDSLATSLKLIANNTDLWIISNGRNYGTSLFVSKIFNDRSDTLSLCQKLPVFISLTHWGSIDHKELLMGINDDSQYFYAMEYKLWRHEDENFLNPYQNAYILLDNGRDEPLRSVVKFRQSFEMHLRQTVASQGGNKRDMQKLALVTLVIGGDQLSLSHVLHSVREKNPVVIINNTGPISQFLSDLYYELEDAFNRTRELTDWPECDRSDARVFCKYLRKNESHIRTVFECEKLTDDTRQTRKMKNKYDSIVRDLKEAMRNRYYITIIDNISDSSEDPYSIILQAIYKGCTRQEGLMISLNSRSPQFLEALFHRDVDPQFTQEKEYINAHSLNRLHYKNFSQVGPVANVLNLISKREFEIQKGCHKEVRYRQFITTFRIKLVKKGTAGIKTSADTEAQHINSDIPYVMSNVGRIIYLLMGPRYKIQYHDGCFRAMAVDARSSQCNIANAEVAKEGFVKKKYQVWHLFLWSVLSVQPEYTKFFLLQSSAPLGMALIAMKLYNGLGHYADQLYEEELAKNLREAATNFEKLAVNILDNMYNLEPAKAHEVLTSELPLDLGRHVTPLLIANDAKAMEFMSRACCQTLFQKVWKGYMGMETPFWKSALLLVPFFIIPWTHFEENPENIRRKECEGEDDGPAEDIIKPTFAKLNFSSNSTHQVTTPELDDEKTPAIEDTEVEVNTQPSNCCTSFLCSFWNSRFVWKYRCYYTAPVTKFYMRMISYLTFLGLLSYYVLTDLRPHTTLSDITTVEWILIVWILNLALEELAELVTMRETGPLHNLKASDLNDKTWHRYEKVFMRLYRLQIYCVEGWNYTDITMISLLIVSFILRFSLPPQSFQMARIFFAVGVIVSYFRLLSFWYVLKVIGPRIIAINMMMTELIRFLLILAVFVMGFGIAFQAILQPNQEPSMSALGDILWRPYWQMFGELFLDDEAGMGRDVHNSSCGVDASGNSIAGAECFTWAAPILLGVYLLIANVLLLNLLVAIFSQAYDDVQEKSHTVWLFNLYSLIREFYYHVWLPPPLSTLCYIARLIYWLAVCRRSKFDTHDHLRTGQLEPKHDLQKKACRNLHSVEKAGKRDEC